MYDAKIQMETQDLIRELEFQAYKDYQPSEDLCTIGTAIRSLNHTQLVAKGTASAFNASQLDRQIGKRNMSGGKSVMEDKKHRWNLFLTTYCDPRNNNWYPAAFTGLTSVCGNTGGGRTDRVNADIDYTRTIDIPRTIDIFGPAWTYEGNRKDEHDAYQLANNLYGHNVLSRNLGDSSLQDSQVADQYMSLRSVAAARNVATSSYNEIIGLKAFGSTYEELNPAVTDEFLGRILINLGIPEKEVVLYLGIDTAPGAYASTYAVLEILAKKIYQDPNFYSSLYETPENVKRKRVAMKAIGLMLDRQLFESQIRQEMAMSVLLSSRLRNHMKKTNVKIGSE